MKSGTIAEFVQERAGAMVGNREQIEAFGKEFFLLLLQVLNTKENGFSLVSLMRFPRLDVVHLGVLEVLEWSWKYFAWREDLPAVDRKLLSSIRVTWE